MIIKKNISYNSLRYNALYYIIFHFIMIHYNSLRSQMFFCIVFAQNYHLQTNQQAARSSFTKLLSQVVIQNCDIQNPY